MEEFKSRYPTARIALLADRDEPRVKARKIIQG
jgi:hypothetical protein